MHGSCCAWILLDPEKTAGYKGPASPSCCVLCARSSIGRLVKWGPNLHDWRAYDQIYIAVLLSPCFGCFRVFTFLFIVAQCVHVSIGVFEPKPQNRTLLLNLF